MEAAKIILIALFYAKILYSIVYNIYIHGKTARVFEMYDEFIDTSKYSNEKLDRALMKGVFWIIIEGVIVSVLFYYAGIFDL